MTFKGILKRNSFIYKDWIGKSRVGGEISHVLFHRTVNNEFVTNVLTQDQVGALTNNTHVYFEMTSVPPTLTGFAEQTTEQEDQLPIKEEKTPKPEMLALPAPEKEDNTPAKSRGRPRKA